MGPFQQSCSPWLKPRVMPLLVAVIEELGNSFEEENLDFLVLGKGVYRSCND